MNIIRSSRVRDNWLLYCESTEVKGERYKYSWFSSLIYKGLTLSQIINKKKCNRGGANKKKTILSEYEKQKIIDLYTYWYTVKQIERKTRISNYLAKRVLIESDLYKPKKTNMGIKKDWREYIAIASNPYCYETYKNKRKNHTKEELLELKRIYNRNWKKFII